MITTRKLVRSGIVATALAAGGVIGAQSLASAQYGGDAPTDDSSTGVDETPTDESDEGSDVQPLVGQVDTDTTVPGPDGAGAEDEDRRGGCRGNSEAIAAVLGMTTDELRAARDGGQSLADIAAAQGVPVDSVVDAIVDGKAARLADEVAAGELTQAEADERLADAEERAAEKVAATPGERDGDEHGEGDAPATDAE